ncbi:ribosomal protein S6 [Haematococcus lacustris]
MPLYELMCLAKPALARPLMVEMMKRVGKLVTEKGGVVTDIKSFGDQHLAYDIRRPYERYAKAHIWQMTVMTGPAALREVLTELRNNDNVLRYISIKRDSQLSLVPQSVLQKMLEEHDQSSSPMRG